MSVAEFKMRLRCARTIGDVLQLAHVEFSLMPGLTLADKVDCITAAHERVDELRAEKLLTPI